MQLSWKNRKYISKKHTSNSSKRELYTSINSKHWTKPKTSESKNWQTKRTRYKYKKVAWTTRYRSWKSRCNSTNCRPKNSTNSSRNTLRHRSSDMNRWSVSTKLPSISAFSTWQWITRYNNNFKLINNSKSARSLTRTGKSCKRSILCVSKCTKRQNSSKATSSV